MRGEFAAKLTAAHCAGLLGLAIAGTVLNEDPGADDFFVLFVFGLVLSAFLFLPLLAVTLVFLRAVLRHRLAFLLLGPVAVTALVSAMFGTGAWKPIALQTGLSSLVLFLLLRGEDDPESAGA